MVDLFTGTARYYAQFRIPYPETLLSRLRAATTPTGTGRLIDLGCGTGEIAVKLSPYFRDVVGVDPNPGMLDEARARAARAECRNVAWRLHTAEELMLEPASVELVTIAAAFHWMDRALVARRCARWLAPGRTLAVLGSNSPWTGTAEWQALARDVMRRWTGGKRRAGSDTFAPAERHEDILAREGFDLESIDVCIDHTWTLDTFLGYLRSTSFASREVLGAVDDFDADMRRTLLDYDASGRYSERVPFYCILGTPYRRP